jgi:hypothetical protein
VPGEEAPKCASVGNRKPEYNFFRRKNYEAGSRLKFYDDKILSCDRKCTHVSHLAHKESPRGDFCFIFDIPHKYDNILFGFKMFFNNKRR